MNLIRRFSYILVLFLVFTLPFYTHTYIPLGFATALTMIFISDIIKKRTLRFTWQEAALLLILILAMVYAALDKTYIQPSIIRLAFYYGLPLLMLLCIRRVWVTSFQWSCLGYAYLTGCIVSAAVIIGAWIAGNIELGKRLSVGDINANYISYSLATGVFVGLTLIAFSKTKIRTNIIIYTVIFISLGVLLSGTRGSTISVVALLFSYYCFQMSSRPLKLFLNLIAAIAIGTVFLSMLPESVYLRILSGSAEDISSGRYELWSVATSFILNSPLVGNGLGYFQAHNALGAAVHNVFLSILVEFGAIGLLLYSFVLFSIVFMKNESIAFMHTRKLFIISWLPIAMTGVWEFSIVMWFVYAWISSMPVSFRIRN